MVTPSVAAISDNSMLELELAASCRLPLRMGTSAGSITSVSTMTRSSTISQPTAMRPRSVLMMRRSCRARSSTTVLATDSARPKVIPAPIGQPSRLPSPTPKAVATAICTMAPGTAMSRTDHRSFSEKCRPTPNISRMTPISASSLASDWSATKPGV